MEKEIFEFTIENKVTDVGLRLAVASRVPDELDIRADNITENKVKIYLKGSKESIERFYSQLKEQKLGDAEDYTFSELKLVEPAGCMGVNTDRFFHKLQCEQLGKFVEVGTAGFRELGDKIDGMGDNLGSKIDGLGERMDSGFDGLGNKIDEGFGNMSNKLDDLPKEIAKELREVLKSES